MNLVPSAEADSICLSSASPGTAVPDFHVPPLRGYDFAAFARLLIAEKWSSHAHPICLRQ